MCLSMVTDDSDEPSLKKGQLGLELCLEDCPGNWDCSKTVNYRGSVATSSSRMPRRGWDRRA